MLIMQAHHVLVVGEHCGDRSEAKAVAHANGIWRYIACEHVDVVCSLCPRTS